MALAQRQPARFYPRPALRPYRAPEPHSAPRVRTRAARVNYRALFARLLVAAALAGTLIAYLTGYMMMTGANYERVQLKRQLMSLRTQHQLLSTEQIRAYDKSLIEQWARDKRMVRPESAPVMVASGVQKGQQGP